MESARVSTHSANVEAASTARQLQTLRDLRRQLRHDDVDLNRFVAGLAAVPDAAGRVIASANSALVGSERAIRDLRHAVVYIGLRRVDGCLTAVSQQLERSVAERRAA